MKSKFSLLLSVILFLGVAIADQYSKQYILHNAKQEYYVNTVLAFTPPAFNRGIAAGMLQSSGPMGFILLTIAIALIIIGFGAYTYNRWLSNCSIIGEALVLGGALSNLLDRFLYHGVVDFILLHYARWSLPLFNIADAAITLGVIIMFITAFNFERRC